MKGSPSPTGNPTPQPAVQSPASVKQEDDDDDNKYVKQTRFQERKERICFAILGIACFVALAFHHHATSSPLNRLIELDAAIHNVTTLDSKVRAIRKRVAIFETDPEGQAAKEELQDATRRLLHLRYGLVEPYRVRVDLEFQPSIPDFEMQGRFGSFLVELAPSSLQPHSIYTFLEVCRWYRKSSFHRIAPHVLQTFALTNQKVQSLAFQEYSDAWPHRERTLGYAGRPSGPDWYVSIMDNTADHGPGSQQDKNPYEADSCFGKVIEGYDTVVKRITKVPGKEFLDDEKLHVKIQNMEILIQGENGDYIPWKDVEKEVIPHAKTLVL